MAGYVHVQMKQWRLQDTVSSMCSPSVLLSAVGTTRTYNTNSSSASIVTVVRNHSHTCACAVFTSRGYYLRAVFISFRASDCAATIRGWRLASIWRNMAFITIHFNTCTHTCNFVSSVLRALFFVLSCSNAVRNVVIWEEREVCHWKDEMRREGEKREGRGKERGREKL